MPPLETLLGPVLPPMQSQALGTDDNLSVSAGRDDSTVVTRPDTAVIGGVAPVDALTSASQVDICLDRCGTRALDARIPGRADSEAGTPGDAGAAVDAALPAAGLRLATVGATRALLDADVVLAPADDASPATGVGSRRRWLERNTPLVVVFVPLLVGIAVVGGDAERFVAALAAVARLVLVEPVDLLAAPDQPVHVGLLARLLLGVHRGEGQVALALLDVNLLGIGADGRGREPDLVLGCTTVQVLVLEEGVPGTPVVGSPAVAVAALALGLSHTPDRLAAINQPVARIFLAALLGGVERGPVGDLA
jgi:hypothetical protein